MVKLTREAPEALGDAIDEYHDIRELRLAMEKEVRAVAEIEQARKADILARLSEESGISGAAGQRYRAQRTERRVPVVKDWTTLYNWIRQSGRFDVLQKRLLSSAVQEMWDADEEIPGVDATIAVDLSVTKVR